MEDLENKLNSVLNDPKAMEQIMHLAQHQTLTGKGQQSEPPADNARKSELSMVQRLSGIARQSGIDKNQQSLLRALGPYLSRQRIQKLERAMRAAKMASMAGILTGR